MAPIPLFKVGALVIRTLAKPVAARLMVDAKSRPAVARVCVVCGEFVHQLTSRIHILASGYRIVGVPPLPKEEALNNGVSIVSEFLVFCVAGSILIYEYNASEQSSAAKAAVAAKEKEEAKQRLEDRLCAIDTQLLVLADRLQSVEKTQAELQASTSSGAVPYGWILGLSSNSSTASRTSGASLKGSVAEIITIGRATENLPSALDDSEVDEGPSSSGGSAAAGGGGNAAKAVDAGDSGSSQPASAGSNGKTWLDWLLWR